MGWLSNITRKESKRFSWVLVRITWDKHHQIKGSRCADGEWKGQDQEAEVQLRTDQREA